MFEAGQGEKQSSSSKMWIGLFVVVALIGLGVLFYTMSKSPAAAPTAAASNVVPAGKTDPVHDLKIVRVTMDKDRDGVTAVWFVVMENRSNQYTYSDIKYETSYMGADNKSLLENNGTITATIEPGQQKSSEIRDAMYPPKTAWFKFRVTGAKATE
jgi:hypothetical protein